MKVQEKLDQAWFLIKLILVNYFIINITLKSPFVEFWRHKIEDTLEEGIIDLHVYGHFADDIGKVCKCV